VTSSAIWSLAFGVIAATAMLVLATGARRTLAIGTLLVMVPFQTIDTRYGSSSTLMAYALAGVLALTGGLKLRMLPAFGFIVLGYCMSFAMADRNDVLLNAVEMFQFFSAFVVFILAYNFARSVETERSVIDVLLVINAMAVVYCMLQLTVGPGERFTPFGIEQLAFNPNRTPDDPRLIGPFGNPGNTAGYFTLMTLVCGLEFMFAQGRRKLVIELIIFLNLLGIVATGNRTGFLILVGMFPIFLYAFRQELGAKRLTTYLIGGFAALAIASVVALQFTDFNRMFSRMQSVTETSEGLPKTRANTWSAAVAKIKEDPWFGKGPYYPSAHALTKAGEIRTEFENLGELTTAFDPYPHCLYLYLLRTVGIVGLIPVVGFFLGCAAVLYASVRRGSPEPYRLAITRLGLLLILAFLLAQVTLEFNRSETMDYAQFIFALMGLLIGTSDRDRQPGSAVHGELQSAQHSQAKLFGNRLTVS
jgi:O-antigen ligase